MWPETEERLLALMTNMSEKAATYHRKVDFGLRVHVIVRETETEARAWANRLMSKLEAEKGKEIRERALDAQSYGVSRQAEMRESLMKKVLQNDIFGQVLVEQEVVVVQLWSVTLTKYWQKFNAIWTWAFDHLFFLVIHICKNVNYLQNMVLPNIPTVSLAEAQGRILLKRKHSFGKWTAKVVDNKVRLE